MAFDPSERIMPCRTHLSLDRATELCSSLVSGTAPDVSFAIPDPFIDAPKATAPVFRRFQPFLLHPAVPDPVTASLQRTDAVWHTWAPPPQKLGLFQPGLCQQGSRDQSELPYLTSSCVKSLQPMSDAGSHLWQ